MSPLPQRRKSAEELAALRASLGIPAEPGVMEAADAGPEADPVPEAEPPELVVDEAVEEPARLRVSRSLRKSEQGPVLPRPVQASGGSGKLPARRRSERELREIQRSAPLPAVDPAQRLVRMGLPWWGAMLVYLVALAGPLLAAAGILSSRARPLDLPRWWADLVLSEGAERIWIHSAGAGVVLMLLLAAWLFWRRKRAAHHAAILVVMAVLVLTFGILYFFPELHGT